MGIKNNIFALKKATRYSIHPWTRETRSNDFWVFSKMADHSLIPRSSPLLKMAVESNFPPLWISKSPPTCTLRSLIPVGCPPPPPILGQTTDRCINYITPFPRYVSLGHLCSHTFSLTASAKIHLFVSPCPLEFYLQSETKIKPDLRLGN